jgi:hypothetical protein
MLSIGISEMNIINKIKACLVDDWKKAYKWVSVQIAAVLVFLPMLMPYMPELSQYLPTNWTQWLGGAIIVARIIAQKKASDAVNPK